MLLQLAAVAALTVAFRLPFLLHADRFFDSDEAVEGLMARHVLQGELPVFLWGQQYKGVPEVYLAAAVFSVAGSSVIALKATTLMCFVAFVCVEFLLVEALFSTWVAWMAVARNGSRPVWYFAIGAGFDVAFSEMFSDDC